MGLNHRRCSTGEYDVNLKMKKNMGLISNNAKQKWITNKFQEN